MQNAIYVNSAIFFLFQIDIVKMHNKIVQTIY